MIAHVSPLAFGLCLAAVGMGNAPRIAAQSADSLGGIALDSAGSPVYGALIVAYGTQGQVVARAVSGRRGVFMMPMPSADSARLVVHRVGYQVPRAVMAPPGARPATFSLSAPGKRLSFSGDKATQRGVCGTPRDATSDVTVLWNAARIVLESSQLRFGREDVVRKVSQFDRVLATDGKVISSSTPRERDVISGPPYISLSPDSIDAVGYVVENRDDASYYAPDANIMLSPSFTERSCFGVVAPTSERPDLVGLSFKPLANRDRLKDIGGIFWFSRETLELQKMEYRYTNVPTAFAAARVGGELTFTLLPVGAWIISRWEIRMPQGEIQTQIALQHSITRERRQVTVEFLRAAIGEVRSVRIGADAFTIPSPRP